MSKTGIRAYDAARYLKDEADCAGYLRAVMEDDGVTEKEIASALGDIARAGWCGWPVKLVCHARRCTVRFPTRAIRLWEPSSR